MRPQTLVALLVALGCGLGAMVMAQKYLGARGLGDDENEIFVATKEINMGEYIKEDRIKKVKYPKRLTPKDAIMDQEKVVGRVARYRIAPEKDIICEDILNKEGSTDGLAASLTPGRKAVTIRVQTAGGVAGLIRPQSIVDVSVYVPQQGNIPATSKVILEQVKILAVNTNPTKSADSQANQGGNVEMVTFELNDQDANIISFAATIGTITLQLRNPEDKTRSTAKAANLATLFGTKGSGASDDSDTKPDNKKVVDAANVTEVAKPGFFDFVTKGLKTNADTAAAGKNAKEEEVKGDEKATTEPEKKVAPPDTTPKKKRWKLVYRDVQGKPVMQILLDDDAKMVGSLKDTGLLEPVEDGEDGSNAKSGGGTAPIPPPKSRG